MVRLRRRELRISYTLSRENIENSATCSPTPRIPIVRRSLIRQSDFGKELEDEYACIAPARCYSCRTAANWHYLVTPRARWTCRSSGRQGNRLLLEKLLERS